MTLILMGRWELECATDKGVCDGESDIVECGDNYGVNSVT
jgi:hypothetical protein